MRKLYIKDKMFIDSDGNQVILSGINLVCKDKSLNYIEKCNEDTFKWFASMGFNVIRLGLIWDGVEPNPGVYNDNYLNEIGKFVKLAEKYGIYVFLDMHQDLFSCLYADGAPEWATLNDGLPHTKGDLWSDAYLESEAVIRSFDNFWANKAAEDGVGVQDRYADMWKHVACFFKDYENVTGFDIMNEPYMGSSGQLVLGSMIETYAKEVMGLENAQMDELASLWFDEEKRVEVLAGMADMEVYKKIVANAGNYSRNFETEVLIPFFNKVTAKIREVDKERFIFFETNYFSNMAIESGVVPITDPDGNIDSAQVYAPHGYDLVVDTDKYDAYNQPRVDLIFETHKKVQQRLNTPVLVGEWGAFTNFDVTYDLAINLLKIFEKYQWSNTFWCYYEGMEKTKYIKALKRSYPMAVSGEIIKYDYDFKNRKFTLEFMPNTNIGETVIFYPEAASISKDNIYVSDTEADIHVIMIQNSDSGYIKIVNKNNIDKIRVEVGL